MRAILIILLLTMAAIPMSANAQSFGDILGVIEAVVEIDKQNAESKRQEEIRKKKEHEQAKQHQLTAQSSPTGNASQTNAVDDGGYGDVYDSIQSANSVKTDAQLFDEIRPYLNKNVVNICAAERHGRGSYQSDKSCEQICKPLKGLLDRDYYPAVSLAINDTAKTIGFSFLNSCAFKIGDVFNQIYSAVDRVPEIKQSKFDTYNLFTLANNAKRYDEARNYLLLSANLGFYKAQYQHAVVLLSQNHRKEAFIYLNKSAEQGYTQAIRKLKQEYDFDFVPKKTSTTATGVTQLPSPQTVANTSLSSISATTVPSVMAKDYWIKNENVTVFDKSNTKIGALSFGAKVTTYGEKGGLGKIDLMEDKWVRLSDLSTSKPTPKKPRPTEKVKIASIKTTGRKDVMKLTRYVSGSSLNYRDAPNGNKLGAFPYATKLTVYERSGKWVRVSRTNETDKWVHEDYVSNSKPKARTSNSNINRTRSGSLSQGVTRMSMNACKSSIFTAARNRGVTPVNVINTRSAYISRVPISSNRYDAYDLVTCSRVDRTRGVKRIKI